MLTAVDLFSGGGGLSVGLKRAGFTVVAAVENDVDAFSTYKTNHPEVRAFRQDIRTVRGTDLLAETETQAVDLVSGCPPCQGFSSLTSKYRRYDLRNDLVHEMTRLVRELMPSAVMMENVPGLAAKGAALLLELISELEHLGYIVSRRVLQVADFGIPQRRRRLVLLAGKGFGIDIPPPTHSREGSTSLPRWRTLRDAIADMPAPITLRQAVAAGGPQRANWHVIRSISDVNMERLRQAKPGGSWLDIDSRIRPECHRDDRAGYFANVYGRMTWDAPSVTITAGCTTLSKGRFGHPEMNRTISVREAARIQTFPDDYIFDTPHMDRVCAIIGNALPCDFATVLSSACARALIKHRSDIDERRD
jgi:DNA (cytosine-5)-methyltransferase 1